MQTDLRDYVHARATAVEVLSSLSRRDAALLVTIEAQIGSIMTWPSHMREKFLSSHLRFNDRFQLTLFLLGNRVPPLLIAEWYLYRGMLKDKSARENVASIIKQHMDGELESKGFKTWVMGATSCKPACLRRHKWDGVGDDGEHLQASPLLPSNP